MGNRKTRIGQVVSDKMEKTVVVAVESTYRHPLYKRVVKRTKKFLAHDGDKISRTGDVVRIVETRPFSARKRWRVVEVLMRRELAEVQPSAIG